MNEAIFYYLLAGGVLLVNVALLVFFVDAVQRIKRASERSAQLLEYLAEKVRR